MAKLLSSLLFLLLSGTATFGGTCDAGAPVSDPNTAKPCWESDWQNALERAAAGSVPDREYLEALTLSACPELGKLAKILLEDLNTQDAQRLKLPSAVVSGQPDWSKLDIQGERVLSPGVLLLLRVDPSGQVQEVEIKKSSGNAKVDALCVEAMGQSLYRPARANGRYIASELVVSVHINVR